MIILSVASSYLRAFFVSKLINITNMLILRVFICTSMTESSVFVAVGDGTFHFKVLVPSVAAGAIIGKGGETIAQLQKDTGARVKMSKSHDFYPGILLFQHKNFFD